MFHSAKMSSKSNSPEIFHHFDQSNEVSVSTATSSGVLLRTILANLSWRPRRPSTVVSKPAFFSTRVWHVRLTGKSPKFSILFKHTTKKKDTNIGIYIYTDIGCIDLTYYAFFGLPMCDTFSQAKKNCSRM